MAVPKVPESQIEDLKTWVKSAGADWCGVQQPLTPGMQYQLLFTSRKTGSTYQVPIDDYLSGKLAGDSIAHRIEKRLEEKDKDFQEPKMTLNEKLFSVYSLLESIEKNGENTSQNYDYIKAVDVVRAIRAQLIAIKVYAEVNFFFEGVPYTIARAKYPDAPFSARDCRCVAVFHDLESQEISTGSGLGTGADTGDKAIYKAQTGAFKYALKNSFMVPDEAAPDAEGDPTVDENAEPDFDSAKAAPRKETKKEATKPPKANIPASTPAPEPSNPTPAAAPLTAATNTEPATPAAASTSTKTASVSTVATAEPVGRSPMTLPPSEEMLTDYRKRFRKLGDELAEGHLKSSKSLPVGRKLLVFLLNTTGAKDPKDITKQQWEDFFTRVDTAKGNPECGLAGIAKLVNRANGIEDKK